SLEKSQNRKFAAVELREIFNRWHEASKPCLRPEQTKLDYFLEFMRAYDRATKPLDESALGDAWARANSEPLPPEALQFGDYPELQRLVALCRQLQIIAAEQPFFLSCYTVQGLFKLASHTTAWKWLGMLRTHRIIELTKQGDSRHANRYRYLPPI